MRHFSPLRSGPPNSWHHSILITQTTQAVTASKDCAASWAQEVTALRSRFLAILLISACILSGVASATPVAVRYKEGLIHGFLVLSESAEFLYRVTDFWAPVHERAILWNDPDLNIHWPLPPGTTPVVSRKDAAAVCFRDAECFL